jgi:hypothetical protein
MSLNKIQAECTEVIEPNAQPCLYTRSLVSLTSISAVSLGHKTARVKHLLITVLETLQAEQFNFLHAFYTPLIEPKQPHLTPCPLVPLVC